jgi:hypothetical protein
MKKYQNLLVFISLLILIIAFSYGFTDSYFQQDEWHGFGLVISFSNLPIWKWFTIISGQHYFPFSMLFWAWLFQLFNFDASSYAITSISLHALASYLVFIFIKNLSKNIHVALLSSVLFALNSRADQAFLHLAVFPSTITSFILIILVLIYLLRIFKKERIGLLDFSIISILFLASLQFREDGLILIPLVPIFIFIFSKKTFNKNNLKFFIGISLVAIGFLIFRILIQISDAGSTSETNPNIISLGYLKILAINALSFPIKIIVENLIEISSTLYFLVDKYRSLFYSTNISPDANVIVLDLVFLLIFNFIVALFLLLKPLIKSKQFYKFLLFSFFGIIFYSFLLSAVGRTMSVIEPRYLYFTSFLIMSLLSWILVEIFNSKLRYLSFSKKVIVLLFIFTYIFYSYSNSHGRIEKLKKESLIRESLISQILKLHPTIPKDVIFFIKCKEVCVRNSEFGINNKLVLPFSSGPGWIILLQYAKNNQDAYSPFFNTYNRKQIVWDWHVGKFKYALVNEFLWDMGAQGYRRVEDYSFGYFIDLDLLRESLKKEKLNKNVVIGLEYDEKNFIITDISKIIQKKL